MPRLIAPVGLMLGPEYADDSGKAERFEIARAAAPWRLPEDHFQVWVKAHGTHIDASERRTTRQLLLRRAKEAGIASADSIVDRLLEEGNLVEFETARGSSRQFLARYRLKPLGLGYGNDPSERFVNYIGRPGDERAVSVPSEVRLVWAMGVTSTSMWERVDLIAKDRAADPENDQDLYSTDPDVIAELLVSMLPVLLASSYAFLDDHEEVKTTELPTPKRPTET